MLRRMSLGEINIFQFQRSTTKSKLHPIPERQLQNKRKNARRNRIKRSFLHFKLKAHSQRGTRFLSSLALLTDLSDGSRSTNSPDNTPKTHPMTIPTGPWSNWWVKSPDGNTTPHSTLNRKIAMTSFTASIDRITVWMPLFKPKPTRHRQARASGRWEARKWNCETRI